MRKLILLVSIIFIYTLSLLLVSHTKDYYLFFNFCVIPIIVGGYFLSTFHTIATVAFCSFLALTLVYGKADLLNIYQSILLFVGCAFIAVLVKTISDKIKLNKQSTAKLLEEELITSGQSAEKTSSRRARLENQVSQISNLYHSVKKMGSCFAFEDLLTTLRDIMSASFEFKRCELISLYPMDEAVKIDKIYLISEEEIKHIEGFGYEEGLLEFMLRKKQTLEIGPEKAKLNAEEFVMPANSKSFLAAPIIFADKINAILVTEDIKIGQRDHFAVLANQFSMALERIRLYELVQELAITDGLTGVFVRRHMIERLADELSRADRFHTKVSLIMIDIDNFKVYNDKHGHLEGDVLLKETALKLKAGIREIDVIARYGGEEFCIILPDTNSKSAEFVANRLREDVAGLNTTISLGVATYPLDAKNYTNLIEKADKMLYKAKNSGKNKVCIYEK